MNTLSWLFILIELLGKFVGLTKITMVFSGSIIVLLAIVYGVLSWEYDSEHEKEFIKKWLKTITKCFVFASIFWVVLPSPSLVYKIIASEIGEEVIESEEMQLLREIILEKLKEEVDDYAEE